MAAAKYEKEDLQRKEALDKIIRLAGGNNSTAFRLNKVNSILFFNIEGLHDF